MRVSLQRHSVVHYHTKCKQASQDMTMMNNEYSAKENDGILPWLPSVCVFIFLFFYSSSPTLIRRCDSFHSSRGAMQFWLNLSLRSSFFHSMHSTHSTHSFNTGNQ